MAAKPLPKVHLIRSNDFEEKDFNALILFLNNIFKKERKNSTSIFIPHKDGIKIAAKDLTNQQMNQNSAEFLINSPYFGNQFKEKKEKDNIRKFAKNKTQQFTSWNVLYNICANFRSKNKDVQKSDLVILLTNTANNYNYFSALDDKNIKNGFIHTDLWDFFLPGYNKIYPIAYEIIGLIVHSNMGCSYSELAKNYSHQSPAIGCISDMCVNKSEINIKIRTGDICENCLEKLKEHIIFDDVYFLLKFLDAIRNETLRTFRYLNINKKISDINLVKTSIGAGVTEIEFTQYKKTLQLTGPLHKAIYIYLLRNANGITIKEFGIEDDDVMKELAEIYQSEAKGKNKLDFNKAYQTILNQFEKSTTLEDKNKDKDKKAAETSYKFKKNETKSIQPKIYSVISKINASVKSCVIGNQPLEEYKIHTIKDKKAKEITYKVIRMQSKVSVKKAS